MANALTKQRKEQRAMSSRKRFAMYYYYNLPDDVVFKLMDIPHPKLTGEVYPDVPHSMYTYVMWLCQQGYEQKAKEVVDANTSSN
jgi:hypothetical protein